MIPQFNNNNNNNNNNQYGNYNQNQNQNQGQYNNQKKEYNNYYIYIPSFLIGQEFKYSCQVREILPDGLNFFASKTRIFKNEFNTMSPVLTISIDLDKDVTIEKDKTVSIHDFINNYQSLISTMKSIFSEPAKVTEYLQAKYKYDTLNFLGKLNAQNELLAWKKTIDYIVEKENYQASKNQHNNNIQTNNAPQQINIITPQTSPQGPQNASQQVIQQTPINNIPQSSPDVVNLDNLFANE